VGPRAGLDTAVKRENSQLMPGLEPQIIQPVAECYITELTRLLVIIRIIYNNLLSHNCYEGDGGNFKVYKINFSI
jgi:hypothetical protein